MCKYPQVYVQDGAAETPPSPYVVERAGISPLEIVGHGADAATLGMDAYHAATNANRAWKLYQFANTTTDATIAYENTAAADVFAAEAIGSAGAFAIGSLIFIICLSEPIPDPVICRNPCPICNPDMSVDPSRVDVSVLCNEAPGHSDEHCCGNQHNWP